MIFLLHFMWAESNNSKSLMGRTNQSQTCPQSRKFEGECFYWLHSKCHAIDTQGKTKKTCFNRTNNCIFQISRKNTTCKWLSWICGTREIVGCGTGNKSELLLKISFQATIAGILHAKHTQKVIGQNFTGSQFLMEPSQSKNLWSQHVSVELCSLILHRQIKLLLQLYLSIPFLIRRLFMSFAPAFSIRTAWQLYNVQSSQFLGRFLPFFHVLLILLFKNLSSKKLGRL